MFVFSLIKSLKPRCDFVFRSFGFFYFWSQPHLYI